MRISLGSRWSCCLDITPHETQEVFGTGRRLDLDVFARRRGSSGRELNKLLRNMSAFCFFETSALPDNVVNGGAVFVHEQVKGVVSDAFINVGDCWLRPFGYQLAGTRLRHLVCKPCAAPLRFGHGTRVLSLGMQWAFQKGVSFFLFTYVFFFYARLNSPRVCRTTRWPYP